MRDRVRTWRAKACIKWLACGMRSGLVKGLEGQQVEGGRWPPGPILLCREHRGPESVRLLLSSRFQASKAHVLFVRLIQGEGSH